MTKADLLTCLGFALRYDYLLRTARRSKGEEAGLQEGKAFQVAQKSVMGCAQSTESLSTVAKERLDGNPVVLAPLDKTCHSTTLPESISFNSIQDAQSSKQKAKRDECCAIDKIKQIRKADGHLKTRIVHLEVPHGKPIEDVYEGVHTGPILGAGVSGEVRLVTHKATGVNYAVKSLDLGKIKAKHGQLEQMREEIVAMMELDHPNIVRLEEVYESNSKIYLVQELCTGGDLFDRLDAQPPTEAQCAHLVKQMLCSVRYLHSKGIIHRDLKLENFLFSSSDADSEIKMIDFGLCHHFKCGEVQHEAVGTPYTIAPETINGSYDEKCDVWAIGVITFLLLSGSSPFGGCGETGQDLSNVSTRIRSASFEFEPKDVWSTVSPQARDFIQSLLVVNPQTRPTAVEAQQHLWIHERCSRGTLDFDKRLSPKVVQALVSFREYSDMRKLLCEVLSFTLLPDQLMDLRKEFQKMDTDGSGEISLSVLKQALIDSDGTSSLGALTEAEVEDVFNAMRVQQSEQRVQWHEFIAAGMSKDQVDDRNIRLAFERLDSDHKGYITFENVMDLVPVGNDPAISEEVMRKRWDDSIKAMNCQHARISYEQFAIFVKGQQSDNRQNHGHAFLASSF